MEVPACNARKRPLQVHFSKRRFDQILEELRCMGETDVTIKNVTLAIKHVLDFDPNETNPHTVYKNDFIRKKAAELGKSIYEVSGMKARYHRKKAAANTTQP